MRINKLKYFLIISLSIIYMSGFSQSESAYSLKDCYESAINNYPNLKQIDLNAAITELNKKNIKTNFYPSLNLSGQASWQSDVTKVPQVVNIPGFTIEELSQDWYKVNLDVEQMIYDGGLTSNQKDIEDKDLLINDQKIQVEIYQLKEKVNNLFFNIVYLEKNTQIIKVLIESLQARLEEATHAFENGMLLQADLDALKVEINSNQQRVIELQSDIDGLISSLNEISGLKLTKASQLKLETSTNEELTFVNNRPEYLLLSMQQEKISSLKKLTTVKRRPLFMAFGQMGYGRPGYDMLNNSFDDYYMIGARLKWNIWDWGKVKRQKQVLDIQNNIIETNKLSFEQGLKADAAKKISDINKYRKLIESDVEIVMLQESVVKNAANQLDNGAITSTTYLLEVNKKLNFDLKLESHKLQLYYARIQYLTALGNN